MKSNATPRLLVTFALAVMLCAGATPSNAAWTYTAGLAGLSEYEIQSQPYRDTFGMTWGASGSVADRSNTNLAAYAFFGGAVL